jgi:two-component system cell cycle sensor histidine kinase/response regulator CckA
MDVASTPARIRPPRRERLQLEALAELFRLTTPGPAPLGQLASSSLGVAASLTVSSGGAVLLGDAANAAAVWGDPLNPEGLTALWNSALSRSEAFCTEEAGRHLLAAPLLAAPLLAGGRLTGLFVLARPEPEYSPAELAAVAKLVDLYALSARWVEAQPELAFLRAVVESMREAVTVTDVENRLLFVNDAFRTLYGYTDEELTGKPIEVVVSRTVEPGTPDTVLTETCHGGWQGELTNRKKDGTEFPIHLSTAPVENSQGEIVALVGVTTDITEFKAAEQALRASEAELLGLFSAMQDAVFVTSREGRFLRAASILPILPDPVGRTIPEVLPAETAERLMFAVDRMKDAAGPVSAEFSLPAGGEERWFEARVTAVDDHLLWVVRDMTEHRKEEARRRELEEQLAQSQKLESVGRLAGGIAHDFNNLLTVINGYAALLLTRPPTADSLHIGLMEIHKAGERAAALVHQLLAFSRRQILQPRLVNVNEVVGGLQHMLMRLEGDDVQLILRLDPGLPAILVDPHQLERVIVNLAVNARDAMPAGGKLTIETARVTLDAPRPCHSGALLAGEYVKISVSDTGTGMDEAVRSHLFEPFFTTKEVGRGSGLGLSTVHGIVAQSGGRIDVSSVPGAGATFDLYFRASAADASADGSSLPLR